MKRKLLALPFAFTASSLAAAPMLTDGVFASVGQDIQGLVAALLFICALFLLIVRAPKSSAALSLIALFEIIPITLLEKFLFQNIFPEVSWLNSSSWPLALNTVLALLLAVHLWQNKRLLSAFTLVIAALDLRFGAEFLSLPVLLLILLADALRKLPFNTLLGPLPEIVAAPTRQTLDTEAASAREEQRLLQDEKITLEIAGSSLKDFALMMNILDSGLVIISQTLQRALIRDDKTLKKLYLQVKTGEELARLLGYLSLASQIENLSFSYARLLKEPELLWNPIRLTQDLDAVRRAIRLHLRISSQKLGRKIESEASLWPDSGHSQLGLQAHLLDSSARFPALKKAQIRALSSFQNLSWTDLDSKLSQILKGEAEGYSCVMTKGKDYGANFQLSFEDGLRLRDALKLLIDNSRRHGFADELRKKAEISGEIEVITTQSDACLRVSYQDKGRGLFILGLKPGSKAQEENERVARAYAQKLLSDWRAPRGLTTLREELKKMESSVAIEIYPEQLSGNHCPFAVVIEVPLHRLEKKAIE